MSKSFIKMHILSPRAKCGFAVVELLVALSLVLILLVMQSGFILTRHRIGESGQLAIERDAAYAATFMDWVERPERVMLITRESGEWQVVYLPDESWLPMESIQQMGRGEAFVYWRSPAGSEEMLYERIQMWSGLDWMDYAGVVAFNNQGEDQ